MAKEDRGTADPVGQELQRIFGELNVDANPVFLLLPLINAEEALKFLRSVPAGSSAEVVRRMASEFRAANPAPKGEDFEG